MSWPREAKGHTSRPWGNLVWHSFELQTHFLRRCRACTKPVAIALASHLSIESPLPLSDFTICTCTGQQQALPSGNVTMLPFSWLPIHLTRISSFSAYDDVFVVIFVSLTRAFEAKRCKYENVFCCFGAFMSVQCKLSYCLFARSI